MQSNNEKFAELYQKLYRDDYEDFHKSLRSRRRKAATIKTVNFALIGVFVFGLFYGSFLIDNLLSLQYQFKDGLVFKILALLSMVIVGVVLGKVDIQHLLFKKQAHTSTIRAIVFVFFTLFGTYWLIDILVREPMAKVVVRKKVSYDTNIMCDYHLRVLQDRIRTYALFSTEQVVALIYRSERLSDIRLGRLNTEFLIEKEKLDDNGELSTNHISIKIENGIISIEEIDH